MFLKNVFNIALKLNNHIIWKKHKINFLFRKNDAEKKILPAYLQI